MKFLVGDRCNVTLGGTCYIHLTKRTHYLISIIPQPNSHILFHHQFSWTHIMIPFKFHFVNQEITPLSRQSLLTFFIFTDWTVIFHISPVCFIFKINELFRANRENTSYFLNVAYPPNRFVQKSVHECKHSSPFFDKSAWLWTVTKNQTKAAHRTAVCYSERSEE